ncbi:11289_t:CDS:2 [Paraglomus brasilianum]|uniref:11289_t:CDS:1 n=1 Tax=Paraglomus brasilianum TaxID=144538 RepID=A0A9N8YW69_9GLOM|nr:11289_t:CDS:2 [Paraglomus brasilianum]
MTTINAESHFEFTIDNVDTLKDPVFTPPFATDYDLFWQLKFTKTFPQNPDYSALFLYAIPTPEEKKTYANWIRRRDYTAAISIKDTENNTHLGWFCPRTDRFSLRWKGQGTKRICRADTLPEKITIGVHFNRTSLQSTFHNNPLPPEPYPEELALAWGRQLEITQQSRCNKESNLQEVADVKFVVEDRDIFAHSWILEERSEYFRGLFRGRWIETTRKNDNKKDEDESVKQGMNDDPETNNGINTSSTTTTDDKDHLTKYTIHVPDFHPTTFYAFLQFLYTNTIHFAEDDSTPTTPYDMLLISDKYLVTSLRDIAKMQLIENLTPYNVMEILLKKVRSYEDIRSEVMVYVKDNIVEIEKTSVWKNIIHMCDEGVREAEEIESGEGSDDFLRAGDTSDYVEIMNELVQFLREQKIRLSHDKDPEDAPMSIDNSLI